MVNPRQENIDKYLEVLKLLTQKLDRIHFKTFKNTVFCKENHVHTNFFTTAIKLGFIEVKKFESSKMYRTTLSANEVEPHHARKILEKLFEPCKKGIIEYKIPQEVIDAVSFIKKHGFEIKISKKINIEL